MWERIVELHQELRAAHQDADNPFWYAPRTRIATCLTIVLVDQATRICRLSTEKQIDGTRTHRDTSCSSRRLRIDTRRSVLLLVTHLERQHLRKGNCFDAFVPLHFSGRRYGREAPAVHKGNRGTSIGSLASYGLTTYDRNIHLLSTEWSGCQEATGRIDNDGEICVGSTKEHESLAGQS